MPAPVHASVFIFLLGILMMTAAAETRNNPVVIAHRGASAYTPEHTLLAVTAAHVMGADFIEQDVVLSQDGVPVILHDIHLEPTTNVTVRFPGRTRDDGHYYAIDFSLAELKTLSVTERRNGAGEPVFSGRFPQAAPHLEIPTLEEEILLISGLNASRGRQTGLYIEFKAPRFHTAEGHDIASAVLAVLERHHLNASGAPVYLQCFDPDTLKRLKREQLTPLPLIQLIASNAWGEVKGTDFDAMRTDTGLKAIAEYADGIGPWLPHVLAENDAALDRLADRAHQLGLLLHPYTLRADALGGLGANIDTLHQELLVTHRVDGVFTDFPDLTRTFIDSLGTAAVQ